MQETKQLGNHGEQLVEAQLCAEGFRILARNYLCRVGELDLVAIKGDVVAFVEVKTRRNAYFPIATVVTLSKQQKIIRAAQRFLLQNQLTDKVYRFDVATVLYSEGTQTITYIPDAFRVQERRY